MIYQEAQCCRLICSLSQFVKLAYANMASTCFINYSAHGTRLYGHPLNTDTRILQTVSFIATKINLLNTDTG